MLTCNLTEAIILFFLFGLVFLDRVSPCTAECPETQSTKQAVLELEI